MSIKSAPVLADRKESVDVKVETGWTLVVLWQRKNAENLSGWFWVTVF